MDKIITVLIAVGILIGVTDTLRGNKWKLGEKFQQGFRLIGSMMISMAGIMTMAPVIALVLKPVAVPLFTRLHMDPSILSILLSCDMGGYPLAMSLAQNEKIGLMLGVVTAGMFGGTLTFTIPLGFGLIEKEDVPWFSRGILIGVGCIPVGSIVSGLLLQIPVREVLWNSLPVLLMSVLIVYGMCRIPEKMISIMEKLGRAIECLGLIGIAAGSMEYLTGWEIIPGMEPLMDSMQVVCQITITLIGMFPVLELFTRILKNPLNRLGDKVGLDVTSVSGMIFSLASSVPVFSLMKNMSKKGIIVNTAWIVLVSGMFGSQLGLVLGIGDGLLIPYMVGKLAAAAVGVEISLLAARAYEQETVAGEKPYLDIAPFSYSRYDNR